MKNIRNILKAQKIANRYSRGNAECHSALYSGAMAMGDWKDTQHRADVRRTLLKFMRHLERRGFIDGELQYDTEHQVDTFLEQMAGK